ncbi:MAG: UDP-glucose 4-epimerase GalE [Nitrosomonadales bacterium]|nr:UDP-glucose 4-epimerase GalE [Nitrosomonadales bacterium]
MGKNMHYLVIGGAGYIGSHMVKLLLEQAHEVTVVDDLSSGHRDAVLGGELIVHDFSDRGFLDQLFSAKKFDGVFHFASQILVGESVSNPAKYYRANTFATLVLLEAMRDHKVDNFVFSSTAAVYGEPEYVPIDESHPKVPVNPYGASKYMVEMMLADFHRAHGLNYVALRYFNAAGADPQARLGERHEPETHLIPLALKAVLGTKPPLKLFGRDYDTPDGTCVRDYIHVDDLSSAHSLAMLYLHHGGASTAFNLGNGAGYSVQQVIDVVSNITGKDVPVEHAPRREGDPARLVADAAKAKQLLGWRPESTDLQTIVQHAWNWEITN